MTGVILIVVGAAVLLWLFMKSSGSPATTTKEHSPEGAEIARANAISEDLHRERDRRSKANVEANKETLVKAEKARQWVTEAKLNNVIPELLDTAQLWPYWIKLLDNKKWTPPVGVSDIEGLQSRKTPWAAWRWNGRHWRIEAERRGSYLPDDSETENGNYRMYVDHEVVLDMTLSSNNWRPCGSMR